MLKHSRTFPAIIAALVLVAAGCGDDDNPANGGTTDTTPPGVVAVTPVDQFHVDVSFSEPVSKSSAEDDGNYTLTEAAVPAPVPARGHNAAPGDPISIAGITLQSNETTVTITTESSMAGIVVDLTVDDVADKHGNRIGTPIGRTFTGSIAPDEEAPQIVYRFPAANAVNVPTGTAVTVQFSEAVTYASFEGGVSLTSQVGPVGYTILQDGTTFTLIPDTALDNNSLHTISLTGVQDASANTLADTEWSFTTTSVVDNTPPTLVSTIPANNAINVNTGTNLSITFSEAINQSQFNVQLVPDPGDGTPTWSNGGRTLTFDPDASLLDDQQYVLTIYPGGVLDVAGNGIEGLHTVVFTTGSALETGSIAGTISGHPGSAAADPSGATVIATNGEVLGGAFDVMGSAIVAGNNTYKVSRLADGYYYLLCILDTSGNGNLEPGEGDAIGAYGVNFATLDLDPDSVVVAGGNAVTGASFGIYDPSSITGTVTFDGFLAGNFTIYVGLFETTDFLATPVAAAEAFWPGSPDWGIVSLLDYFPDGTYYCAAFIDVNGNGDYDPAVDLAGVYGGAESPTPLNVSNGSDHPDIVITVTEPVPASPTVTVSWPERKQNAAFQRLCELARRGQTLAK